METDSIITLAGLFLLVMASAFFSATETAMSSLNRIRMKSMADEGNKRAALVLRLSSDFDKCLSTILVGNNIVNIATASIATVLCVRYFGNAGASIATAASTVVVLVLGEVTPKSLAKESPERFAMFAAPILRGLIFICTPINYLFTQWKKLLSKIFTPKPEASLTEKELLTIVDEAEHHGTINEDDSQLIHSVIAFNDQIAGDILTPRVDIYAVDKDASDEEISEMFTQTGYSRLPVYDGSIDNILGIIHMKDFYGSAGNKKRNIMDILSPAVFVTPSTKIKDLLKRLQQVKTHVAIVTDEYGGTVGMVTMEDILEELVGEIWDEHDEIIEDFRRQEDGTYRIICSASIDKMFAFFQITGEVDSSTVSGWIMEMLGKIPEAGDSFTYETLTVTVVDTDQRHALECVIAVNPPGFEGEAVEG